MDEILGIARKALTMRLRSLITVINKHDLKSILTIKYNKFLNNAIDDYVPNEKYPGCRILASESKYNFHLKFLDDHL